MQIEIFYVNNYKNKMTNHIYSLKVCTFAITKI